MPWRIRASDTTARNDSFVLRGARMTQQEAAAPVTPVVAGGATGPSPSGPSSATPTSWTRAPGDQVVLEHVTPLRAAVRRFLRHRLAIVGVIIVVIVVTMAILAPLLTPWD